MLASGCGRAQAPPRRGLAAPGGAAIFATACSSCHSVIGNESRHLPGGDLLGYSFSRGALTQYTIEMPLRAPLSGRAVQAVVGYVLALEQGAGRGRHQRRPRPT